MAGIKDTILNADPIAFWSFDLDAAGFSDNTLLDEIGNESPLNNASGVFEEDGFLVEQTAINEIESNERHSLKVCPGCLSYGGDERKTEAEWIQQTSHWRCDHSNKFTFPDSGQYTIEFAYYGEFANNWTRSFSGVGSNPGRSTDSYTPILFKYGIFDIYIYWCYFCGYGNSNRIVWHSPVANQTCRCDITVSSNSQNPYTTYYGLRDTPDSYGRVFYPGMRRLNHVVCTFDVEYVDVNEYESRMKMYINGRLYDIQTKRWFDSPPDNSNNNPIRLGARHGSDGLINDVEDEFIHHPMNFDYVAMYSYSFDEAQVSNHYKKLFSYPDLILNDYPTKYYRFNEIQDNNNTTIRDSAPWRNSDDDGVVFNYPLRGEPGPERNLYSTSCRFQGKSSARINIETNDFVISNSYTFEVWFKSVEGQRGIIFAALQDDPFYDGFYVWINSYENEYRNGVIQVAESYDNYIHSITNDPVTNDPIYYNDGEWHHLVVIRTPNQKLQLYIDNQLQEEGDYPAPNKGGDAIGWVADMRPGGYHADVWLSEMAWYQYAWQPIQIRHRYTYATRYRISGYTLLEGAPVEATVRFYDHLTGDKVGEVTSKVLDGEYIWYSRNNKYIDVVSFIPDERTTRYRIHGPVYPAEDYDSPYD